MLNYDIVEVVFPEMTNIMEQNLCQGYQHTLA